MHYFRESGAVDVLDSSCMAYTLWVSVRRQHRSRKNITIFRGTLEIVDIAVAT